ncbi:hypothetical protein AcW2_006071 [Taiwanofungus camphoratus]|nr:hypothetical protein AcW2_006071 [Antrodia cinnamomea]
MPAHRITKGKKRALQEMMSDAEDSDTPSSLASDVAVRKMPIKKPKRAETRICPVCEEAIPVRLLAKHSELESQRVEEIVLKIGSMEVLADAEPDDGLTSRSRRSTLKSRKSLSSAIPSTSEVTLEQMTKALNTIKRHRKQRHAKLRELTREEDLRWWGGRDGEGEGMVCPVCEKFVRGDVDVVEAHVDSCLAHARILEAQDRGSGSRHGDEEMDVDVDGDGEGVEKGIRESVTTGVSFRGTGFDVRDRNQQDIEDEVDVDGEDETVFGAPQFSEGDILALSGKPIPDAHSSVPSEDEDGDMENQDEARHDKADGDAIEGQRRQAGGEKDGKTLKHLVDEGKIVRRRVEAVKNVKRTMEEVMGMAEAEEVDLAVENARKEGDNIALIKALETKINLMVSTRVSSSTSLLCRICLDPYTEPTVSTGCWHTCCRECWLRCLGSTKLCPICKRITAAADLRRIYL